MIPSLSEILHSIFCGSRSLLDPRLLLLLAVLLPNPSATFAAEPPPNFIVIFCDDLGYGDLGCFGSQHHRTPHLDRAAAEGMKFTSFYSASPVCTPSRAALMTGCYPRRVDLDYGQTYLVLNPGDGKGLHADEITIAELLKDRGYATACIGKWHLGDQPELLPTAHGFDSYFGIPYSNDQGLRQGTNWPPLPMIEGARVVEAPVDQTTITRRYTERALEFLRANREGPFFLYLPHTFPHDPLFAGPAFQGKSANGVYGDAVEELDWSTGQILDELSRLEIDDRTLVVFTSDNGAAHNYGGSNLPLRGHKNSTWEGGQRVTCIMRWPGRIHPGTECDQLSTTMDLLPTLAALAGSVLPTDRAIDGHDIRGLMFRQGDTSSPYDRFLYRRARRLEAIRSGKWKLHLALSADTSGYTAKALYDLDADLAESTNVASSHPEVVQRLLSLAVAARDDLGDDDSAGPGQRPAGWVEDPVMLRAE